MYVNFAKCAVAGALSIGFHRSRGLSVLEILVALTLVGVLASFAIPAYQGAVERRSLSNTADQVLSFLNLVKAEAVQRNRRAHVSYQAFEDGGWCLGATLGTSPCDCTQTHTAEPNYCGLDSGNWVIRGTDAPPADVQVSAPGDGHFTLEPMRRIHVGARDTAIIALQSESEAYRVEIQLSASGRAFICQAEDSRDVRTYKPCSPPLL